MLDQWADLKKSRGWIRTAQAVASSSTSGESTQTELPSHYGVFSSVKDLVKWEAATRNGKSAERIKPGANVDACEARHQRFITRMGLAGKLLRCHGHRMITHTGITGTEYTRIPDAN